MSSTTSSSPRGIFGYVCLAGLLISWIAQSEVARHLETSKDNGGEGYDKPALITFINHSWSVLLLPFEYAVWWFYRSTRRRRTAAAEGEVRETKDIHQDTKRMEDGVNGGHLLGVESITVLSKNTQHRRSNNDSFLAHLVSQGLTPQFVLCFTAVLSTSYWAGDYVWYIGLEYSTVSTGTAVFNSSCVFVCVFSYLLLGETPSLLAVSALAITLCGVALVSFGTAQSSSGNDDDASSSTTTLEHIMGSLLILAASILYALYEVAFGWFLRHYNVSKTVSISNVLNGLLGIFNICFLWMPVLVTSLVPSSLSAVHEPLELPVDDQLLYLVLNGMLAFVFNVFLILSLLFCGAFLTSVACVSTIPGSAIADYLLWGDNVSVLFVVGSVLIIFGFSAVLWDNSRGHDEEIESTGGGDSSTEGDTKNVEETADSDSETCLRLRLLSEEPGETGDASVSPYG